MNDNQVDASLYSLIFEGVEDDSPETMQRLKGVFIADLDLSVPEVQSILSAGHGVVCASTEEQEIEEKFQILKKAGANAYIVRPEVEEDDDEEDEQEDDEGFELELSFDDVFEEEKPKKRRSTVHRLDDSVSLDDTLSELGIEDDQADSAEPEDVTNDEIDDVMDSLSFNEEEDPLTGLNPVIEESDLASLEPALEEVSETESVALAAVTEGLAEAPVDSDELLEQDGSLMGSLELSEAGAVESDQSSQHEAKVNAQGIIPVSKIEDMPLFELGSMGDEVPKEVPPVRETEKPVENKQESFLDLTLAPAEESALLDEVVPRDELETDISLNPTPEPEQLESEAESDSLFGGLDLDSVLDGVVDAATQDLEQAGVLVEDGKSNEVAEDLIEDELETDGGAVEASAIEQALNQAEDSSQKANQDRPLGEIKKEAFSELTNVSEVEDDLEEAAIVDTGIRHVGKASKIPKDVALIVVLGAIVLGVGNYLYFHSSVASNPLEQERLAHELKTLEMKAKKEAKLAAKAKSEAAAAKKIRYSNIYRGNEETDGLTTSAEARIEKGVVVLSAFELRTPKPRELTGKEIVDGKNEFPWLTKVTLDDVAVKLNDDNSFAQEIHSKAFVTQGVSRNRFLGKAQLKGRYNKDAHTIDVEVSVHQGSAAVKRVGEYHIEQVGTKKYAFAAKASLRLKALPEK